MKRAHLAALPLALVLFACESTPPPELPPAPPPAPPPPAAKSDLAPPPASPSRPVTDDYGGLKVTDPYRWLEADDAEVKAWSDAQTKRARDFLDGWSGMPALKKRIGELKKGRGTEVYWFTPRGGRIFALRMQPPAQQPVIVVAKNIDELLTAPAVVDPNKIDPSGGTAMDFYDPSVDGRYVSVSLSKGGSESGDVHVFEVATGKELPDVIPHVNEGTAGGSVAWNEKGTGFWYTRYPRKGERADADLQFYQQVYFHELGKKPETDKYVFGKELPRIAEIEMGTSEDGKHLVALVKNGDGGEVAHYVAKTSGGPWTQLASFTDHVEFLRVGRDNKLYALTRAGAPHGKIVRTPIDKPSLAKAEVVVPEGENTLRGFQVTNKRLYVVDLVGGPSQVRVLDLAGKEVGRLPLPVVPSVGQIVRLAGDEILYQAESFLEPSSWYRFSGSGAPVKTAIGTKASFDYADAEVLRETCTSKDGAKVPVSIVMKKGTPRDGARPALLTGYGGYGVNIEPYFSEEARLMLDKGGVWAIANLRGGAEFGDAWHLAGNLTKKQNVFDDFAACAKRLVELKLTSKDKLAVTGASNGGLLMGAFVTQHPDLAAVVVSEVGIYDMMRSESFPNGAFNITEFGTVKDPAQRDALYAYSPVHHVVDGTKYPPLLLTTGVNDPRVASWQSRKFAARLQTAGGTAPVLLLTRDTGHGIGNPLEMQIANEADLYGFIFRYLGVD